MSLAIPISWPDPLYRVSLKTHWEHQWIIFLKDKTQWKWGGKRNDIEKEWKLVITSCRFQVNRGKNITSFKSLLYSNESISLDLYCENYEDYFIIKKVLHYALNHYYLHMMQLCRCRASTISTVKNAIKFFFILNFILTDSLYVCE